MIDQPRRLIFTFIVACVLATAATGYADAPDRVLKAGAYAMDITPTSFPVSSNGGMSDRQVKAAHDQLHARCLVLDNGETKIAIAVCDSCMIPREIFDAAKEKIAKATGIPTQNQLMSATHTHTAVTVGGVFQSEPELDYVKFLTNRIAEGVIKAHEQREPAQVAWGTAQDPTQVFNRRWVMKPGFKYDDPFGRGTDRVRMNPGRANQALDKPSGPIDPEIGILSVQSTDGRPIALLANYSLHYVGGVPASALSADYFGEFANQIAQRIKATQVKPAFVGIMSNGTSGNVNNVDFSIAGVARQPFEQIRLVAASVAEATFKAYQTLEYHAWVPLKAAETELELGVRKPSAKDLEEAKAMLKEAGPGPYSDRRHIYARETVLLADYPETVRAKIQAIRIGELGIVTSPCETFVETGLAIKENSPLKPTFTIELANGYNGYLPTPEHHELGGYETWRARSSYLAVPAEPKIRATQLKLLKQVAGD